VPVHVEQTGHDLVDRVERRPYLFAAVQAIEKFRWEGAQITVAKLFLAFRQFLHDISALAFQLAVARGRIHQSACGEIVPHEMAPQFAIWLLPPAEWLCGGREPCIHTKIVQKSVGVQSLEIRQVCILRAFECSRKQTDFRRFKRFDARRRILPFESDDFAEWRGFFRRLPLVSRRRILRRRLRAQWS
jgi:hypothetical protein